VKRLELYHHLKEEFLHRKADHTKVGPLRLDRKLDESVAMERFRVLDVMDFRITMGFRAKIEEGFDRDAARQRIFRMICGQLFGQIQKELSDLHDWAYVNGYDKDMRDRIERLERFVAGDAVDET
jgi:hypothetical protein